MRGRGSLPLGLGAKGGAHPPHGRRTPPPLWGLVPHGEGRRVPPSLAYKRRGGGAFSQHNIEFFLSLSFSDLERTPLVWSLHLVGGFTIIRTPSRCRNRDPDHSSFRCSSASEPGGTSVAPYVCNPARHYTCGATSSSEVLQHDREVVGSES